MRGSPHPLLGLMVAHVSHTIASVLEDEDVVAGGRGHGPPIQRESSKCAREKVRILRIGFSNVSAEEVLDAGGTVVLDGGRNRLEEERGRTRWGCGWHSVQRDVADAAATTTTPTTHGGWMNDDEF